MKKIVIMIVVVGLAVGYFLPVAQIRTPIDITVSLIKKEVYSWDWLFGKKDCKDIANLGKDYCSEKMK